MPLYYFDTDDGERAIRDEDGLDLPDKHAARRAAIAALPPIAHDVLPDADTRVVSVTVRDGDHRILFHATLTLVAEWLD